MDPHQSGHRARHRHPAGAAGAAILLGLLAAACNSRPDLKRVIELQPDQAVEVSYDAGNLRLALENDARRSLREDPLAAQRRGAKRFDQTRAQDLLDVLATYGFFERANSQANPNSADHLTVWIDGQNLVFSRPPWDGSPANQLATESFLKCRTAVQDFYNATVAFYGSELTAEELRNEQRRLEQKGEQAIRRQR